MSTRLAAASQHARERERRCPARAPDARTARRRAGRLWAGREGPTASWLALVWADAARAFMRAPRPRLKLMGWTDGAGLGKEEQGLVAPVSSTMVLKTDRDKRGLGQRESRRSIARSSSKQNAAAGDNPVPGTPGPH